MTTLLLLLPKLALALGVLLALVLDSLPLGRARRILLLVLVAMFAAALVPGLLSLGERTRIWHGSLVLDGLSTYADLALLTIGILVTLSLLETLGSAAEGGDLFLLITLSLLGASALASAGNLLILFLGVELAIIPTWAMVAFRPRDRRGFEASFKYFLLSAFATSILLYGLSLVYGTTGTVVLPAVNVQVESSSLLYVGLAMVIVAFAFDLAAFPFHQWLPDALEVSYAEVAGFLAVAPKLAAIIGLVRFLSGFPDQRPAWTLAVALISAVTMFWGNVVAFSQTSMKRLLAYSAIAHAGYALVGVAAGNVAGLRGAVLYYAAYGAGSLGAFLVIAVLAHQGQDDSVTGFDGLGRRSPGTAAAMTVFLLSLTGIPLFAGFWGKFSVFWGAVQGGMTWLAVLGVINSAISLGYYARIIQRMYLEGGAEVPAEARAEVPPGRLGPAGPGDRRRPGCRRAGGGSTSRRPGRPAALPARGDVGRGGPHHAVGAGAVAALRGLGVGAAALAVCSTVPAAPSAGPGAERPRPRRDGAPAVV